MAAKSAARRRAVIAVALTERHHGPDDRRLPALRRDLRALEVEGAELELERARCLHGAFPSLSLVELEHLIRLRCLRILVYQTAQDRVSMDPRGVGLYDLHGTIRWSLVQRTMWTVAVVVRGVLAQDGRQMTLTGDEHPVSAFAANGAHPALRERVRSGAPVAES